MAETDTARSTAAQSVAWEWTKIGQRRPSCARVSDKPLARWPAEQFSRADNEGKEQSHFRCCAPELSGCSSSWRQQTDYISSVCRKHEPLSSSLRRQPVITHRGEGGVAINMGKEKLMGYWNAAARSQGIPAAAWATSKRWRPPLPSAA